MRFISKLEDQNVINSQYNFKARARALVEKWNTTSPRESGEDSPGSSVPPAQRGEETLNFLATLEPSLRRTVLLEQKEEMLRNLPIEIQNEANALRKQAGLSPIDLDNVYNHRNSTALVHLHPVSRYDGASDIEGSDGGFETEYEHSCISATHESTIISCASSTAETDSQTSDTVLSHSRGSTQRGRRPPANDPRDNEVSSASSSSSGSTWHNASHESQITVIARKRLASLSFAGDVDGARFIKEFEKLVERVQPDMSDDDKRMLLVST